LHGVARSVELGAVAARPERVDPLLAAVGGVAFERLRDHDVGATDAGEAPVLGKAAELHRALVRSLDLENGTGNGGFLNEGLVGGIVEDDGLVRAGVGNPGGELLPGCGRSGGVVRVAEVNEIDLLIGDRGDKLICRRAGQVDEPGVGAFFIGVTGVAGHDVGVDVDGVDRIGDRDDVVVAEDVEDVARVALGAVRDKNLVRSDAETGILVFDNGFAKEGITLLRPVALESARVSEFVDGIVHGLAAGFGERLGHVADTTADEAFRGFGIGLVEGGDAAGDLGKEVAGFEF